jgi:hypothetical protein
MGAFTLDSEFRKQRMATENGCALQINLAVPMKGRFVQVSAD